MKTLEIEYNGLNINKSTNFKITQIEGLSDVPIRVTAQELTGSDGQAIYRTLYSARDVSIQGIIISQDIETFYDDRRDLLRAYSRFGLKNTLRIRAYNGQDFLIDAVVTGRPQIIETPEQRHFGRFRIELRCPEPFFRTGEFDTFSAVPSQLASGFPLMAPLLTPLGKNDGESIVNINNIGDTDVYPEIKLEGRLVSPEVRNLTTGESFRINTTIPEGRHVIIKREQGDEFVLLDGVTSYYQFFQGEVFRIAKGNNTIQISSSGSTSDDTLLSITYQNLRDGI